MLPKKGTKIFNTLIWDMRRLSDALLPAGLETVGEGWFAWSDIQKVTISASVREIGKAAFACCLKLREVCFEHNSVLEIINTKAFAQSDLESFTAPAHLKTLGQGSFHGCRHLKRATLNEGLEVLGVEECAGDEDWYDGVFEGSALESVVLPSTLKRIERKMFRRCANLRKVSLPDALERIGRECFAESGLESAEVPRSVSVIDDCAFQNCHALKTVQFQQEGRLKTIRKGCFQGSALAECTAPLSVEEIRDSAFCGCMSLKHVVFGNDCTLRSIGKECPQASGLEMLIFSSSLAQIGEKAFSDCDSFKNAFVEEGCRVDVKQYVGSDVSVMLLPPKNTMVGDKLLWDLRATRNVVIPDGVEKIRKQWFAGCAVESVEVPVSVTEIEEMAFFCCYKLRDVVFAENS